MSGSVYLLLRRLWGRGRKRSAATWYLPTGITLSQIAGAWSPVDAISQSASYIRIAGGEGYDNNDPALVGGVAPNWANGTGWTGNGSSMYLKTGITPTWNYSVVVWASIGTTNFGYVIGAYTSGSNRYSIRRYNAADIIEYILVNGSTPTLSGSSGVYGISGRGLNNGEAYYSGLPVIYPLGAGSDPGTLPEFYLLALNTSGSPGSYGNHIIKRVVIYNTGLTDDQQAEMATRIVTL